MNEHCEHKRTVMWEPHLAGARKCTDCKMVYNPNMNPSWHFELPPLQERYDDLKAQLKTRDEAIEKALMSLNYLYKHKFDLQEFGPSYIYNTIQSINTLLGRKG